MLEDVTNENAFEIPESESVHTEEMEAENHQNSRKNSTTSVITFQSSIDWGLERPIQLLEEGVEVTPLQELTKTLNYVRDVIDVEELEHLLYTI
jgi:hypothetical protein